MRLGFSKVTMDELAAELGMSKKTLYQHFPGKQALLQEVMNLTMREVSAGATAILDDTTLAFIEKLEKLMTFFGGVIPNLLSKPLLQDIQRKAPHVWRQVEEFRRRQINTKFANLVREGIEKGVFRSDVDHRFVVLIYFNAVQHIINPEVLSQMPFTAAEAFRAIIRTIFEGILTDAARTKLGDKI